MASTSTLNRTFDRTLDRTLDRVDCTCDYTKTQDFTRSIGLKQLFQQLQLRLRQLTRQSRIAQSWMWTSFVGNLLSVKKNGKTVFCSFFSGPHFSGFCETIFYRFFSYCRAGTVFRRVFSKKIEENDKKMEKQ